MFFRRASRARHPLLLSVAACGGDKAAPTGGDASARPASSGAARTATASAAAAPAAAPAAVTTGEVEMRDKKKVGFSIELPEGLKDVSERPSMKQYAREANVYDGHSFQVMEANPRWAAAGLDKMVEEAEKSPDAIKNKAKVLDKGTTDGGWYLASSPSGGPGARRRRPGRDISSRHPAGGRGSRARESTVRQLRSTPVAAALLRAVEGQVRWRAAGAASR